MPERLATPEIAVCGVRTGGQGYTLTEWLLDALIAEQGYVESCITL